jgi:3-hydroxyacyl-[acyl-carrier-protein] dehydratase
MNGILTKQLYTHVIKEENSVRFTLADATHPVFKAHFEGNPLLPAFLQVDIAAEIFGWSVTGISRSKFVEPLKPLDKVVIRYEHTPKGTKVVWSKEGKTASEMTLEIE